MHFLVSPGLGCPRETPDALPQSMSPECIVRFVKSAADELSRRGMLILIAVRPHDTTLDCSFVSPPNSWVKTIRHREIWLPQTTHAIKVQLNGKPYHETEAHVPTDVLGKPYTYLAEITTKAVKAGGAHLAVRHSRSVSSSTGAINACYE